MNVPFIDGITTPAALYYHLIRIIIGALDTSDVAAVAVAVVAADRVVDTLVAVAFVVEAETVVVVD